MRTTLPLLLMLLPSLAAAEVVPVTNGDELVAAINAAAAGDEIVLAAGTYSVGANVRCNAAGTAAEPIVVRASELGGAIIEFDAVEGFVVAGRYWTFENLEVRGTCATDSECEHAFHVVGPADDVVIRNNRVINFNAHVKSNGSGDPRVWPDRGLIEGNEFYNEAVRQTGNPVTPLDLVGGDDWVVRRNFIHDFAKGQGNGISYAAFMKGKSRRGVFERNLVACEYLHQGQVRLGLSFGGGGTGDEFCEGGSCTPEHIDGVMQNNIIANCPADVGVYVNEGQNVLIQYNTLYNTSGIDLRFDATTATVVNNVLDGQVRDRNGGSSTQAGNVALGTAEMGAMFMDAAGLDFRPADVSNIAGAADGAYEVTDDFCGSQRTAPHDVGAIDYDGNVCDTLTAHQQSSPQPGGDDVGVGSDVGGGLQDMGVDEHDMSAEPPGDMGAGGQDSGHEPDGSTEPGTSPDRDNGGCGCTSAAGGENVLWGLLVFGLIRRRK